MSKIVHFDTSKLTPFVHENKLKEMQVVVTATDQELREGTGAGSGFRGWIDLPIDYNKDEFGRVRKAAKKIQNDSEVLVGIGIGGSYSDARASIEFLNSSFYGREEEKYPTVISCSDSLSGSYLYDLFEWLGDKDFPINIVSKSDTTTEPSITFRALKDKLIEECGKEEATKRIYATTNRAKGVLETEASAEGYEKFVVPDDIGGRFSILSAVGLLPVTIAGGDINAMIKGAADARTAYTNPDASRDSPYQYATLRNTLYHKGYTTELLENYEPSLRMFSKWQKQLMGESGGKDQKGIYPSSASFTTDLHSLGQYIREGRRNLMETAIRVENPEHDVTIPDDKENLDQLDFLSGRTMNYVNDRAYGGVVLVHTDDGIPVITVDIEDQSAHTLGYLIYWFELAVDISGYSNGINPFNRPGVGSYKRNMFDLLNKPGYEDLHDDLTKRLK